MSRSRRKGATTGDAIGEHQESSGSMRADAVLVARGMAASRERARDMINAGKVRVDGRLLTKASKILGGSISIEVEGGDLTWVSRGSLKLVGGLDAFPAVDPVGRRCIDIGASTGGFTEVLLARGAAQVTAVDVGTGQLHPRVADNAKVDVLDGTNARHLTSADIAHRPEIIVCDASFISLGKVLPAVMNLACEGACLIALIKPQFEVGKGYVGKGGIVRDPDLHRKVIEEIENWLVSDMGWTHIGTVPSPIDGPDGNREFLIAGQKPGGCD